MHRVVAYGRSGLVSASEQIATVERWTNASGYKLFRSARQGVPSIREVLSACRQGDADAVGVTDLSRLAPSPEVLAAVLDFLADVNIQIAVVSTDGLAVVHAPGSAEFARSPELLRAMDVLEIEAQAAERHERPIDSRWRSGSASRAIGRHRQA